MNQSGYADLLNQSIIDADSLVIGSLTLPNLDKNSVTYIDVNNNLADIILNNGQLLIGSTNNPPIASTLTGTANEVIVTNGAGSITLSTPQDIATTSSPTFNNLTLTSLNTIPISNYIITPSTSDLDMNSHSISNVVNLNGTAVSNYIVTPATQDLNMNSHEINHLAAIRPLDTNLNIGNSTSLSVGGVGQIVVGDFGSSSASNCVCIGLQNVAAGNSVAIGKETAAGTRATVVGYRSTTNTQTDSVVLGHDNHSNSTSADILGINLTNSTANSLLIGNTSYVNIRAANTTTDLGTSLVPFQNIYSNASLIGTTNSRTVDSVVSGPGSATSGHLVSFNGTSGVVVQDSGIISANVITDSGNLVSSNLVSASGSKTITDSGIVAANVITDSGNLVTSNLVSASGAKTVTDSGIVAANVITDSGNLVTSNLVSASGAKTVTDSGIVAANVITDSGNLVSSNLVSASGAKTVTDSGIVAANVITDSSNLVSSNLVSASGSKTVTDSGIVAANVITDSGNLVNNNLVSGSGSKTVKDSAIASADVFLRTGSVQATGNFDMNVHNISNIAAATFSNTSLVGTTPIISIDNTYSDGNYINFGTGGRNIGVFNGGALFITFNADYNATSNVFKYNATNTVNLMQLDATNGHLQYAVSGTAGNTVTVKDALTWDTTGAISIPNNNVNISSGTLTISGGIVGVTTNSNASTGIVGEYVEASASLVTSASNAITNITSISLTAGDWQVFGCIGCPGDAGTGVVSHMMGGLSSTSATIPATTGDALSLNYNTVAGWGGDCPVPTRRFALSSTTTIYLVAKIIYTGTNSLEGRISARRMR